MWIFEHSGDTIRFDAPETRRYAVLGDSFTAGQYLARNWPDRLEDHFAAAGQAVQLMNFSVHGGGLGNWSSIIQNVLRKDHYDLDGLIFGVYCGDLNRQFSFADDRGRSKHAFAHVPGFRPETYPRSLEEARPALAQTEVPNSFILTTEEFDAVLKGEMLLPPRWEFKLASRIKTDLYWQGLRMLERWRTDDAERREYYERIEPQKTRLVGEVREYVENEALSTLVVYIWTRPGILSGETERDLGCRDEARDFAAALGGDFVDGGEAFAGVPREQLEQLWLPHDGHWGQGASDVFAGYLMPHLQAHIERNAGP